MKLGGNENFINFCRQNGVPEKAPWTQKYPSKVIDMYKEKLAAAVDVRWGHTKSLLIVIGQGMGTQKIS